MRAPGSGVRDLNADGSLLLLGQDPIQVWDVATGKSVAVFDGHQGWSLEARLHPRWAGGALDRSGRRAP